MPGNLYGISEPAALIFGPGCASFGGRSRTRARAVAGGRLEAAGTVVPVGVGAHGTRGQGCSVLHGPADPGAGRELVVVCFGREGRARPDGRGAGDGGRAVAGAGQRGPAPAPRRARAHADGLR